MEKGFALGLVLGLAVGAGGLFLSYKAARPAILTGIQSGVPDALRNWARTSPLAGAATQLVDGAGAAAAIGVAVRDEFDRRLP